MILIDTNITELTREDLADEIFFEYQKIIQTKSATEILIDDLKGGWFDDSPFMNEAIQIVETRYQKDYWELVELTKS